MNRTTVILKRELASQFLSPSAYVILGVYWALAGILFVLTLLHTGEASLRNLFENLSVVLALVCPAMTMRLLAEERRSGTAQILLAAPVSPAQVVGAKFLAVCCLFVIMIGVTALYVPLLVWVGSPNLLAASAGFIGVLLLGLSYLAIGMVFSALSRSQLVAAMSTLGVLLLVNFAGSLARVLPARWAGLAEAFSFTTRYSDFSKGVVDSGNVAFFLVVTGYGLFLTATVFRDKHWR